MLFIGETRNSVNGEDFLFIMYHQKFFRRGFSIYHVSLKTLQA